MTRGLNQDWFPEDEETVPVAEHGDVAFTDPWLAEVTDGNVDRVGLNQAVTLRPYRAQPGLPKTYSLPNDIYPELKPRDLVMVYPDGKGWSLSDPRWFLTESNASLRPLAAPEPELPTLRELAIFLEVSVDWLREVARQENLILPDSPDTALEAVVRKRLRRAAVIRPEWFCYPPLHSVDSVLEAIGGVNFRVLDAARRICPDEGRRGEGLRYDTLLSRRQFDALLDAVEGEIAWFLGVDHQLSIRQIRSIVGLSEKGMLSLAEKLFPERPWRYDSRVNADEFRLLVRTAFTKPQSDWAWIALPTVQRIARFLDAPESATLALARRHLGRPDLSERTELNWQEWTSVIQKLVDQPDELFGPCTLRRFEAILPAIYFTKPTKRAISVFRNAIVPKVLGQEYVPERLLTEGEIQALVVKLCYEFSHVLRSGEPNLNSLRNLLRITPDKLGRVLQQLRSLEHAPSPDEKLNDGDIVALHQEVLRRSFATRPLLALPASRLGEDLIPEYKLLALSQLTDPLLSPKQGGCLLWPTVAAALKTSTENPRWFTHSTSFSARTISRMIDINDDLLYQRAGAVVGADTLYARVENEIENRDRRRKRHHTWQDTPLSLDEYKDLWLAILAESDWRPHTPHETFAFEDLKRPFLALGLASGEEDGRGRRDADPALRIPFDTLHELAQQSIANLRAAEVSQQDMSAALGFDPQETSAYGVPESVTSEAIDRWASYWRESKSEFRLKTDGSLAAIRTCCGIGPASLARLLWTELGVVGNEVESTLYQAEVRKLHAQLSSEQITGGRFTFGDSVSFDPTELDPANHNLFQGLTLYRPAVTDRKLHRPPVNHPLYELHVQNFMTHARMPARPVRGRRMKQSQRRDISDGPENYLADHASDPLLVAPMSESLRKRFLRYGLERHPQPGAFYLATEATTKFIEHNHPELIGMPAKIENVLADRLEVKLYGVWFHVTPEEIAWERNPKVSPKDVRVRVSLEREYFNATLSLRCQADPWGVIQQRYPVGSRASVRSHRRGRDASQETTQKTFGGYLFEVVDSDYNIHAFVAHGNLITGNDPYSWFDHHLDARFEVEVIAHDHSRRRLVGRTVNTLPDPWDQYGPREGALLPGYVELPRDNSGHCWVRWAPGQIAIVPQITTRRGALVWLTVTGIDRSARVLKCERAHPPAKWLVSRRTENFVFLQLPNGDEFRASATPALAHLQPGEPAALRLLEVLHRFDGNELVMEPVSPKWNLLASQPVGTGINVRIEEMHFDGAIVGRVADGEFAEVKVLIPQSEAGDIRRWHQGETVPCQLTHTDVEQAILIVSREKEVREKLTKLAVGNHVTGSVRAVLPYGAIVRLDDPLGLYAFLHMTQIAWLRPEAAVESLKSQQKLQARIRRIESGRIEISSRDLTPSPWIAAAQRYKPGTRIDGTVLHRTWNANFVEVEPGIDGRLYDNIDAAAFAAAKQEYLRPEKLERRQCVVVHFKAAATGDQNRLILMTLLSEAVPEPQTLFGRSVDFLIAFADREECVGVVFCDGYYRMARLDPADRLHYSHKLRPESWGSVLRCRVKGWDPISGRLVVSRRDELVRLLPSLLGKRLVGTVNNKERDCVYLSANEHPGLSLRLQRVGNGVDREQFEAWQLGDRVNVEVRTVDAPALWLKLHYFPQG